MVYGYFEIDLKISNNNKLTEKGKLIDLRQSRYPPHRIRIIKAGWEAKKERKVQRLPILVKWALSKRERTLVHWRFCHEHSAQQ